MAPSFNDMDSEHESGYMPAYLKVKEKLLGQIISGSIAPGGRIPSEPSLARAFGISRMTARRALEELAKEAPIIRVKGKGTFLAEGEDDCLRTPRQLKTVRLIASDVHGSINEDSFYYSIFMGAAREVERLGLELILHTGNNDKDIPQSLTEGLIVLACIDQDRLDRITSKHQLTCLVDSGTVNDKMEKYDRVLVNNYDAMAAAVEYLYDMGHRRMWFAAQKNSTGAFQKRLRACRDMSGRLDIKFNEDTIFWWNWDDLAIMADEIAKKFIHSRKAPTAVCCVDDEFGVELLNAFNRKGVQVPQEVSVCGLGGKSICKYAHPKLTSIFVDGEEMGRVAVRKLYDRANEPNLPVMLHLSSYRLEPGQSVKRIKL